MKLLIGDRVRITIYLTERDSNNNIVPQLDEQGNQKKVSVPAKVKVFEQDTQNNIYTTFTFPSGKDSIPYTKEQVQERIVPFQLTLVAPELASAGIEF